MKTSNEEIKYHGIYGKEKSYNNYHVNTWKCFYKVVETLETHKNSANTITLLGDWPLPSLLSGA